jgi:CDP-glucose 4,6-dehydratase
MPHGKYGIRTIKMSSKPFQQGFKGKSVLVTGHTGFKGSWLTQWLLSIGAKVTGISNEVPTTPSLYEALDLKADIEDIRLDITDFDALSVELNRIEPDIVFHLAAQPIVKEGLRNPSRTFLSNSIGTMHLLESVRVGFKPKAMVMITSDKAYRNNEWEWGYRESDELGGDDPYSASKGCAELIIRSYVTSFFSGETHPNIASARAGNVIGGGDWSDARIIPDAVKAWVSDETLTIRSPKATRPWQHVLEPLSGYLTLGAHLLESSDNHGESYNFGPDATVNKSVNELLEVFSTYWQKVKWQVAPNELTQVEHGLLKLCCDKALAKLEWQPTLSFDQTVEFTASWYKEFYDQTETIKEFTLQQINNYEQIATKRELEWVGLQQ